jgi:hypothetical protein
MTRANLLAVALGAVFLAAVPAAAQDTPATSAAATATAGPATALSQPQACMAAMPDSALSPTVQYLGWISQPAPTFGMPRIGNPDTTLPPPLPPNIP